MSLLRRERGGGAVTEAETMIDSVAVHPVRYIQLIGVQPEDCFGFVPDQQDAGAVGWNIAYRDTEATAAARAAPGSAPPQPTLVIHRLYPKLRTHGLGETLEHHLERYRAAVGLRAADTYGLLPIGVGRSRDRNYNIWEEWHLVYRERPEYAARRPAYAQAIGAGDAWPPPQVVAGEGRAGTLSAAESGAVRLRTFDLPRTRLFGTPGEGVPQAMMDALVRAGVPADRCFALCPDYRQRELRLAHLG